jgi:stringent starvation protein B
MSAIVAIYARENGAGTIFDEEPGLREEALERAEKSDSEDSPSKGPVVVESASDHAPSDTPQPPKGKGKPSLKVVK